MFVGISAMANIVHKQFTIATGFLRHTSLWPLRRLPVQSPARVTPRAHPWVRVRVRVNVRVSVRAVHRLEHIPV